MAPRHLAVHVLHGNWIAPVHAYEICASPETSVLGLMPTAEDSRWQQLSHDDWEGREMAASEAARRGSVFAGQQAILRGCPSPFTHPSRLP